MESKNIVGGDESVNPDKVFFAKRDLANGKHRSIALAQMSFYQSRDNKMYTTTDFLANINLDNSKDERNYEQSRKNHERLLRSRAHT